MSLADLPPAFSCTVDPDRERVFVRPTGELDLSTVDRVERDLCELRDAGFDRIVLDLRGLVFMDSTGLSLLLRWSRLAEQDGYTLEVRPGSPEVMRVIDLADVRDTLPLVAARRFER